jgi:pyridoxine 5-phosphate synthase
VGVPRLDVSLDSVAAVRQARRDSEPDPVQAALLAELAGASAIVVHLRGDRRHVQDRDVEILRRVVKTRLYVEAAPNQETVRMALTVKPDQITMLAERGAEPTTEGGLDVVLNSVQIKPMVSMLRDGGVRTCLFIEPDLEQVKEAHKVGADAIEISTISYAAAAGRQGQDQALRRVADAARLGRKLDLEVHAGQGLNYHNVRKIGALDELSELVVGHAVVSRALLVGMGAAVRDMLAVLGR